MNIENEFVDVKKVKKILNVCTKTLQNYDKEGKIEVKRTAGNRRMYNLNKYLKDNNLEHLQEKKIKKKILYSRVSSYDRKDDLKRQSNYLKSKVNKVEEYELVTDIGSGINFKRKGLQYIINLAINNELEELVINYKDRLCRIGYDLIEYILKKYSNTKIIILNKIENDRNEEITKDLIEIITVYSSKLRGTRNNNI